MDSTQVAQRTRFKLAGSGTDGNMNTHARPGR